MYAETLADYATAQEDAAAEKGQISAAASTAKPKARGTAKKLKCPPRVDAHAFIDDEAVEVRGSACSAAVDSEDEFADHMAASPHPLEEEHCGAAAVYKSVAPAEVRFFMRWSVCLLH